MKILKTLNYKESQNYYMDPEHVKEDSVQKKHIQPEKKYPVRTRDIARSIENTLNPVEQFVKQLQARNKLRLVNEIVDYIKDNPRETRKRVAKRFKMNPFNIDKIIEYFKLNIGI
jgi:hypothetical protein